MITSITTQYITRTSLPSPIPWRCDHTRILLPTPRIDRMRWMQRSMTAIFARTTSRSTMGHPPQEDLLWLSPDDADVLVPARQVRDEVDVASPIRVGDQPARFECLDRNNRRGASRSITSTGRPANRSRSARPSIRSIGSGTTQRGRAPVVGSAVDAGRSRPRRQCRGRREATDPAGQRWRRPPVCAGPRRAGRDREHAQCLSA
jgi:hypothetical protein